MRAATPARALLVDPLMMLNDAPPTQSPLRPAAAHGASPPPNPSSPRIVPSLQQSAPRISGSGAGAAADAVSAAAASAFLDSFDATFNAMPRVAGTSLAIAPPHQLPLDLSCVGLSLSLVGEAEAGFGAPPTSSAPPPAPLLPHAMPPPPPMPPPTLRPLAHRRCSAVPASNGGCGGGVGGSGGCRSYGWLSTALVDQRRRSPAAVPAATSHAVAARDRCSAICPPLPSPPAGAGAAVWVVG